MAFKLKKREFTADQVQKIQEVSNAQKPGTGFQPTLDGSPIFKTPSSLAESKLLVYVPNHTMTIDGEVHLRADRPLLHPVTDGATERKIRCTAGAEELGYSSCPLCEGTGIHWDLANLIIEDKCKAEGLDPSNKENKRVKEIRAAAFSDRKIKQATRYITFPIVVINTKEKDKDGLPEGTVMWFSQTESFFKKKWDVAVNGSGNGEVSLDDISNEVDEVPEDVIVNPAGNFFLLDYSAGSKDGKFDRMLAGLNYKVAARAIQNSDALKAKFDKMTESWTPENASQNIVNNLWYEEKDLQDLVDAINQPVLDKIEIYKAKAAAPALGGLGTAEQIGSASPAVAIESDLDDDDFKEIGGTVNIEDLGQDIVI